ncbi:MAG: hypothetical protein EAZ77_17505 [Nostocales cyanobacterium]|nr:MAG: hypothetical protein EAZ77_17505 [Nostocales cyanobacterium]
MEPSKLTITRKDRVTLEFDNGRTLEASRNFFEFVGTELAESQWTIPDLVNCDDTHRVACDTTHVNAEGRESIWFANKYLKGCGITTIYEWYIHRESVGKKTPGKKLPNGQKVSDQHIVLP